MGVCVNEAVNDDGILRSMKLTNPSMVIKQQLMATCQLLFIENMYAMLNIVE